MQVQEKMAADGTSFYDAAPDVWNAKEKQRK